MCLKSRLKPYHKSTRGLGNVRENRRQSLGKLDSCSACAFFLFRQAKGGVWNGGGWIRQISGPEFWNFRA